MKTKGKREKMNIIHPCLQGKVVSRIILKAKAQSFYLLPTVIFLLLSYFIGVLPTFPSKVKFG